MSQSPAVNINRYRMNSHSSMNDYSHVENQREASGSKQKKQNKKIPLILKKMNSVEKYVYEFKTTQMIQKQYRPKREQSPLYDPSFSNDKHLKKILEKTPDSKLKDNELKDLQQKCYIKYSSISQHDYGTKHQLLENAQTQYVKLKHSIHIAGIAEQFSVPQPFKHSRTESTNTNSKQPVSPGMSYLTSFVNPKSIYLLNKKKIKEQQGELQSQRINQNDIKKELKTSVIEEDGKKYYADLYLMKRERDKMLKEIFGTTEKNKSKQNFHLQNPIPNTLEGFLDKNSSYHSNNASVKKSVKKIAKNQSQKKFPKLKVNITQVPSNSYEEKMRIQEQNFIQQKILRDRSEKKQKMLKGRNMNWNVYYEMLALSKNEKDKIKEYCKFSQTYGED